MKTYTLTTTAKQHILTWTDGTVEQGRRFYQRYKQAGACHKKIAQLELQGYTEKQPEPSAWEQLKAMVRG